MAHHDPADLLSALVAIDSTNPDLVPGAAGEGAIASFVAGWLRERGLEVFVEEPAPGRPNVIAVARGSGGGRTLMLNAHMDTVGVAGMQAPFNPSIQDGRLYGRGAADTKGGLAAFMLAAIAAREQSLRGDVILTAVADEEYASLGTEALIRKWRADAALVAEPTNLRLIAAHKGFVWLDIETFGVAAHGSRPEAGVDAIAHMGYVLVALHRQAGTLARRPSHPLLGPASVHASLITGGQELSSYPASCRLKLERRTLPGESGASVASEWRAIIDDLAGAHAGFRAAARTTFVREPLQVPHDAPILQILRRQAQASLGREPEIAGFGAWTDAALLSGAGIPSVVFGPTGDGFHGIEEWVDLSSVAAASQIALDTAIEFCR